MATKTRNRRKNVPSPPLRVPLYLSRVPAGSFSPAEDYLEGELDFNEYLVRHPHATFCFRVQGDSMTGAGLYSGDLIIVDRAVTPLSGHVVLAKLGGEVVCKRLKRVGKKILLCPENPAYQPIEIDPDTEGFELAGVVTHSIHSHLGNS